MPLSNADPFGYALINAHKLKWIYVVMKKIAWPSLLTTYDLEAALHPWFSQHWSSAAGE